MDAVYDWSVPQIFPLIEPGEIHIWRVHLDLSAGALDRCQSILSLDERQQASRFHFALHRKRFIAAHGILRCILGFSLQVEPKSLGFETNSFGKPYLSTPSEPRLYFNLTHSQDMALIALNPCGEVGIDLEKIQADFAGSTIPEQFFSYQEVKTLRKIPEALRDQAFFNCWTRKEAFIKAIGDGLSFPLDQFDVSLAPGEPAALLSVEGSPEEARRWQIIDLPVAPEWTGALAVRQPDCAIRYFSFPKSMIFCDKPPLLNVIYADSKSSQEGSMGVISSKRY